MSVSSMHKAVRIAQSHKLKGSGALCAAKRNNKFVGLRHVVVTVHKKEILVIV